MKKLLSIFMSITMLLTITTGLTFTASAKNTSPTYDGFQYEILADGTVQINGLDEREYRDNYVVPSYIDGRAVTSIKTLYYYSSEKKKISITIPETVTNIEKDAFKYFGTLNSINVNENNPYYSSVDGVLFSKDKTVLICYPIAKDNTSYTVPNGVKRIGDFAFSGCKNLKELNISDGVEYISYHIFGRIDKYSSRSLNGITAINVSAENKDFSSSDGILFNKDKTVLIAYPQKKADKSYTIPSSVTSIENYAFCENEYLENIVIPENVKSIGDYAFFYCFKLNSLNISDKVEHIGKSAFGNYADEWYADYSHYIDAPEIYYGGSALQWAKLVIEESSTNRLGSGFYTLRCAKPSKLDNFEFYISNNGKTVKTITICGYNGKSSNIVVPSQVEDYKITEITSLTPSINLYSSLKKNIKKITIGSNVKKISNVAFISFTKLESISVSKSNKYFSSSNGVLYNKKKTELIAFPSAKKCSSYKIPASVKKLSEYAFYNSRGLKAFIVAKGNKYFSASNGVLFNKKKTVLVVYPAGKRSKSYTVLKSVKTIDSLAFVNCNYLQTIKLSKKVTSVELYGFYNCRKIKNIYYSGSKSDWKKIGYHNVDVNGKTHKTKYTNLLLDMNNAKIHYNAKV